MFVLFIFFFEFTAAKSNHLFNPYLHGTYKLAGERMLTVPTWPNF